jgi:hypothetical protein
MAEMVSIPIILTTTMGTDSWDLNVPIDVPVQALISKFLRTPQFAFRSQDDQGRAIPYRLLWKEGNRYLGESETLRQANVEAGHTLTMTYEPRAGQACLGVYGRGK